MRSNQLNPLSVRVLVADNSLIHTELLAEAISKDRRIRVVELSTSCNEVLSGVLHARPDVLVISDTLDQRPGAGLDLLRQMRTSRPELKSIVLLDSSKREAVIEAFRAGAKGVFCRNQPVKTLCKCISVVSEGQIWANSSELNFLVEALAATPAVHTGDMQALTALSQREQDVVRCLAEGLGNRDIAQRLNISQHTVKNYMFRIFEKLGVSSRVELLFYVLSQSGTCPVMNQIKEAAADKNRNAMQLETDSDRKKLSLIKAIDSPTARKAIGTENNPPHVATNLGSA